MLQFQDVRYPISFTCIGNGTVTFESVGCGRWDDGQATECSIEYFIQKHNGYAPGDYECKTGIDAVIFPIVFFFYPNGGFTAFTDKENGYDEDSTPTAHECDGYLSDSHAENPGNKPGVDFHFIMGAEAQKFIDEHPATGKKIEHEAGFYISKAANVAINNSHATATVSTPEESGRCPIERMPLGAIIQQVCNTDGDMVDFHFAPNRIEAHNDIITLLNQQRGFIAEVSLHRGCIVQWEIAEIPLSELPF